ncbi:MAG: hypothetical protein IT318_04085 [Anaerolineales bacterium]|nr:hypothetical protein [Anaerolineales bacterium]
MWAHNGWRTKEGQPVKHSELWQTILQAQKARSVAWHCLKGRASRPDESARADELARTESH